MARPMIKGGDVNRQETGKIPFVGTPPLNEGHWSGG